MVSFRGFFWRFYFCMVNYLNFHNSSFALRFFFINVNGKATMWHTPCAQFVWHFWIFWSWILTPLLILLTSLLMYLHVVSKDPCTHMFFLTFLTLLSCSLFEASWLIEGCYTPPPPIKHLVGSRPCSTRFFHARRCFQIQRCSTRFFHARMCFQIQMKIPFVILV